MVTIDEAKTQIETAKQQLVEQEAQISSQQFPEPIRQQLLSQNLMRREQLREQERLFNLEKARQVKAIQTYQQEVISPYEQEVTQAQQMQTQQLQQQQMQYQQAIKEQQVMQGAYQQAYEDAIAGEAGKSYPENPLFDKYYKQFREQAFAEVGQYLSAQQPLPSGIKPVYVGGKLTGYEDVAKGISYGVEQFATMQKPSIELPFTWIPQKLEPPKTRIEKLYEIAISPIKFMQGGYEWQKKLEQKKVPSDVVDISQLPPDVQAEIYKQYPAMTSPWNPTNIATLISRPIWWVAKREEEYYQKPLKWVEKKIPVLATKIPITPELYRLPGEILMAGALSTTPWMQTGMAGTGEVTAKLKKGGRFEKLEELYGTKPTLNELRNALKEATDDELKIWAKKQLDVINKIPDITKQEEAILKLKALLWEAKTGENIITESGNIILDLQYSKMPASFKAPEQSKDVIDYLMKMPRVEMAQMPTLTTSQTIFSHLEPTEESRYGAIAGSDIWVSGRIGTLGTTGVEYAPRFATMPTGKPMQQEFGLPTTKTIPKIKQELWTGTTSILKTGQITTPGLKTGQKPVSGLATTTATSLITGLKIGQMTRQALRTRQILKTKQITRQGLRPRYPRPRKIRIPIPIWFPSGEGARKKRAYEPFALKKPSPTGFEVAVKRRGKFVKVTPFGVPKGEALWIGRKVTKKTAAAQFVLIPTKGVKTLGVPSISETALLPEFRKPIRKGREIISPFTFIQRRGFRIKTPGEKREITYLGIKARRKKGKTIW